MRKIILYIQLGDGLAVQIPATWEDKHHTEDEMRIAAEQFAKQFGGDLLYWEDVE